MAVSRNALIDLSGARIERTGHVRQSRVMPCTIASLACATGFFGVWIANVLEAHAYACSLARMRYESYLILGRTAALALPIAGVLLAIAGWRRQRSKSLRAVALALNLLAMLSLAALLLRWLPLGRLPCLRS